MAQTAFDLEAALAAREEGVKKVASKNATFIETMRGVARLICHRQGTVTADDLKAWAAANDMQPTHYNAYGAIFCSKAWKAEFEFVRYVKSRQVQGHGNLIREWRLRNNPATQEKGNADPSKTTR